MVSSSVPMQLETHLGRSCGDSSIGLGMHGTMNKTRNRVVLSNELKYRNRLPWTIIVIFNGVEIIIALVLRAHLASQNKIRDRLVDDNHQEKSGSEAYDDTYIIDEAPNGQKIKKKVHRAFLDLTDRQNKEFRYVL